MKKKMGKPDLTWHGRMFIMPSGRNVKVTCAPKIWNKFNDDEKALWVELYDILSEELNFANTFMGKKHAVPREVTGHNMACQVVWWLKKAIKEGKKLNQKAGVV